MRGSFALVVGVAVALAAGVMLWDGGANSDAPDPSGPSDGTDVLVTKNGATAHPHSSSAAQDVASGGAPTRAAAVAAIVDGHVTAGRDEDAASALLREETELLADAGIRKRLFGVAERLSGAAASDDTRLRRRLAARRLYAAVYLSDDASRDEHDAAYLACRDLNTSMLFGNAAPDALVLRHKIRPGELLWNLTRGTWKEAGITVAPGFVLHVNGISDARRIKRGSTNACSARGTDGAGAQVVVRADRPTRWRSGRALRRRHRRRRQHAVGLVRHPHPA